MSIGQSKPTSEPSSKPVLDANGADQPSATPTAGNVGAAAAATNNINTSTNAQNTMAGDTQNQPRSNYPKDTDAFPVPIGVARLVDEFSGGNPAYGSTSFRHWEFATTRQKKITQALLKAVANGMESRDVNVDPKRSDLFAKDLLEKSPEFLLKRAPLTDWASRKFEGRKTEAHPEGEGITAFEYALWAKDFKMLEMMLGCIPATAEGDRIRAGLLEQYEQVTAPICAGGGLTYELTYDRPTQDANGIPIKDAAGIWQTTPVTEVHAENHFDMTPLIDAYQDYVDKFDTVGRSFPVRDACWIKIIGTLQRLLPIHILQRYCDPGTPFSPMPSFTGVFKRTTQFFSDLHGSKESLLSSSLSTDFSLFRGGLVSGAVRFARVCVSSLPGHELAVVRQVDAVSTSEIETKIKQLLTVPAQSQTQFRR